MGITEYIHIAPQSGSSRLVDGHFPIQVVPPVSNALLGVSQDGLRFEYVENIARTLYVNLPSSSVTFTYKPTFTFKNTSPFSCPDPRIQDGAWDRAGLADELWGIE